MRPTPPSKLKDPRFKKPWINRVEGLMKWGLALFTIHVIVEIAILVLGAWLLAS